MGESTSTKTLTFCGAAEKWAPEAERLWLEEHPTGKKIYADKMSNEKISLKAKLIAEEDAKAEEAVKQD